MALPGREADPSLRKERRIERGAGRGWGRNGGGGARVLRRKLVKERLLAASRGEVS